MPGLDSQQASELMAAAGASDAGLTAQLVVTPLDDDADSYKLIYVGIITIERRARIEKRAPPRSGRSAS